MPTTKRKKGDLVRAGKVVGQTKLSFAKKSETQKQPSRGILKKGVLKICSKFTGEHTCRSMMSIKLLCKFTKIALWHGCSPVFSEQLLLKTIDEVS